MDRNPKFKECSIKFRENILKDGDVKNIGGWPKTGNVWYIHQGADDLKKPKKIRVVFDTSSRYQGTALND